MTRIPAGPVLGSILIGLFAFVQLPTKSPEEVIRSLVRAMYSNDVAGYEQLTIPDPRRHRLVTGGSVNESALRELQDYPAGLQIKMKRPFRFRGRSVQPDDKGDYPVTTTVLYMAAHRGGPMMVTLVRRPEGWRVDLRWWLAMVDLASGGEPKQGTPDFSARALVAALVRLDRKQAARFAMPNANLDLLFDGAPSQREPSGHLDALVLEMPIVEIGPGEFCEMPSGRVIEGSRRDDMKVLVGLMGSIEIPFIVRRVGAEWRVEPEPYLPLINR